MFNSRKWNSITYGDGYTMESKHGGSGTNLQFTIKYSFGNMRAKASRNQEMEPMDSSGYGNEEMF